MQSRSAVGRLRFIDLEPLMPKQSSEGDMSVSFRALACLHRCEDKRWHTCTIFLVDILALTQHPK
jgi:hypothetical protein